MLLLEKVNPSTNERGGAMKGCPICDFGTVLSEALNNTAV